MIWDELGADRLAPGLDLALLAFALEAGPHAAILALQDALGVARSGALDQPSRTAMQGLVAGPMMPLSQTLLLGTHPSENAGRALAITSPGLPRR